MEWGLVTVVRSDGGVRSVSDAVLWYIGKKPNLGDAEHSHTFPSSPIRSPSTPHSILNTLPLAGTTRPEPAGERRRQCPRW